MIVIKLGGTNGSGKTSVARALIEMGTCKINFMNDAYYGFLDGKKIAVLGDYVPRCGGMDVIRLVSNKKKLVLKHLRKDFDVVFFEGYSTGVSYQSFGAISETYGTWVYAFMETPVDVCVARVAQRRGLPLEGYKPPATLLTGHNRLQKAAAAAKAAGHPVLWLPHTQSPHQHVLELFKTVNYVKVKP